MLAVPVDSLAFNNTMQVEVRVRRRVWTVYL